MALNNLIDKVKSAAQSLLGKDCVLKRNDGAQSNDGFPCLEVGVDDILVSQFLENKGKGKLYAGFDREFAKAIDRKLRDKGTVVHGRMTIDSVYLMTVYPAGKTKQNKYLA